MSAVHHYVPRPPAVTTQAVQWRGDINDLPAEWINSGAFTHLHNGELVVAVISGEQRAIEVGDFIVAGVSGDFFPLPAGECHAAYTEVGR